MLNFETFRWNISSSINLFFSEEYVPRVVMDLLTKFGFSVLGNYIRLNANSARHFFHFWDIFDVFSKWSSLKTPNSGKMEK